MLAQVGIEKKYCKRENGEEKGRELKANTIDDLKKLNRRKGDS